VKSNIPHNFHFRVISAVILGVFLEALAQTSISYEREKLKGKLPATSVRNLQ
jgi:hypothetical protein